MVYAIQELVPSWSCSQAVYKPVWHIPLLCVRWETPDDGKRNCLKHVEFNSKIKFEKIIASSWSYYKDNIITLIIIYLFTAIGLLPGGSGYFTCKQNMNMKLVTTRFKSGGLHEKHVVATWNLGNHLSICCVEVAGRKTFRILTSSQTTRLFIR